MFPPVLASEPLQRRLESEGWTTLPSVASLLPKLRDIHARARGLVDGAGLGADADYYEAMHPLDATMRGALETELHAALSGYVEQHLPGVRLLAAMILVKEANTSGSAVPLHQDFAIVDESNGGQSLQLWIPLAEVIGADRGGIHFLPRSHRVPHPYRARGDAIPFDRFYDRLSSFVTRPRLQEGEPVCFWGTTVHGSLPNLTPQSRAAVACLLAPRQFPLVNYVRISSNEVEEWTISDADLRRVVPGREPIDGRRVRTIEHRDQMLDEAGWQAWCRMRTT